MVNKAAVAVMAAALVAALTGCGGGDDASALQRCDTARAERAADVDPVFYDDSSFAYESMQKPLTSAESTNDLGGGVVELSGSTDGKRWVCLIDGQSTQWGWDD